MGYPLFENRHADESICSRDHLNDKRDRSTAAAQIHAASAHDDTRRFRDNTVRPASQPLASRT